MDSYWDKKATILNYHKKLYKEKKQGISITSEVPKTHEDLFMLSKSELGEVINFEEELARLNIDDFFVNIDKKTILLSLVFGIIGATTAVSTDYIGKHLGKQLFSNYDKNNPADFKQGSHHRYFFGHDIFNPFQSLPEGYQFDAKTIGGESIKVGGKSIYNLVAEVNCKDKAVEKLLNWVLRQVVHYIKDLITPDGLPLPGSSYFTKWEDNVLNACGFSSRNDLMQTLGREYGSIHASDFSSIIVMEFLIKCYLSNPTKHEVTGIDILERQIKVLTYGTCIFVQMLILLNATFTDPLLKKNHTGAKLNLILSVLFTKNVIQLIRLVNKEHDNLMSYYDNVISALTDKDLDQLIVVNRF